MAYYRRNLEKPLIHYAKFPVIALLGPRQSGKTTLAKHTFKNHVYLNLEDLELRSLALEDPKGFLRRYDNEHGMILDEFQTCPDLLSYIQEIVDETDRPGYFILTGSQNFLMNEAISQSLAGRVGILTLLPFSIDELEENKLLDKTHPEKPCSAAAIHVYMEPTLAHMLFMEAHNLQRQAKALLFPGINLARSCIKYEK